MPVQIEMRWGLGERMCYPKCRVVVLCIKAKAPMDPSVVQLLDSPAYRLLTVDALHSPFPCNFNTHTMWSSHSPTRLYKHILRRHLPPSPFPHPHLQVHDHPNRLLKFMSAVGGKQALHRGKRDAQIPR